MNGRRANKLSTIEVAHMLGVAVSSVSKWIDDGRIMAGRTPGGHRRIEKDDLVRFLRQQGLRVPPELGASAPKVLIVDDEHALTKWLAGEIKERYPDFEVIEAHDGYAAGEIVGHVMPEIIILDLHLPGIDGFEVCRRIKSNPRTKHAFVMAVTGDTTPETKTRILEMGANTLLTKPLEAANVLTQIAKALNLAT